MITPSTSSATKPSLISSPSTQKMNTKPIIKNYNKKKPIIKKFIMKKSFPLHKGFNTNKLNPFLKGTLTITKNYISREEFHAHHPPSNISSSYQLCAYIRLIQNHFVVIDLNNNPIQIFHSFKNLSNWANLTFNPLPSPSSPLHSLPQHPIKLK